MEARTDVDVQGTPDEYAIVVENVSKSFEMQADRRDTFKGRSVCGRSHQGKRTSHAPDDVSLETRKGTTFGLIGHNGLGKSTTLKILTSVYRPTLDFISVSDKVNALLELGAEFRAKLTGRENILLNDAILGRVREQIEETFDWIIDFANIGDFIDQPVKAYSSGMTVCLGFTVVTAIRPRVLIVDEIIIVGDEELQRECFDYMRELRDTETTVVLVTHSLSLAQEVCGEVVWLGHGHVKMVADTDETVSAYLEVVSAKEFAKCTAERQEEEEFSENESFKLNQDNGDCRVVGAEFPDAEGDKAPFLMSDEADTVRMHMRAKKDLHDVELGLALMTDQGQTIAGPNSHHNRWLYSFHRGEEILIDHTMDPVLIQPGRFWIITCLTRDGKMFDYSGRKIELIARGDWVAEEPGSITPSTGVWSRVSGVPSS